MNLRNLLIAGLAVASLSFMAAPAEARPWRGGYYYGRPAVRAYGGYYGRGYYSGYRGYPGYYNRGFYGPGVGVYGPGVGVGIGLGPAYIRRW